MSRGIRVAPQCILHVKQAPKRRGFPNQKSVAIAAGVAKATTDRFFNGKPVDYLNFVGICEVLDLDWQTIADLVSNQIECKQQQQHLMNLDSLTQLPNRDAFEHHLRREWRRLSDEIAPLSLILCDIDNFKFINDCFGHDSGDCCLQQVAQVISSTVEDSKIFLARCSGDEFGVILSNISANKAVDIAKSIRSAIPPIHIKDSIIHLTVSLGVASMIPIKEESNQALWLRSDCALYTAKLQGKNCVVLNNS